MHHEVVVRFDEQHEYRIPTHEADILSNDDARDWLDDYFVELDAEPLRASGKVLLADKVLAVAAAAGYMKFRDEEKFRNEYGMATLGALKCVTAEIDVDTMSVRY